MKYISAFTDIRSKSSQIKTIVAVKVYVLLRKIAKRLGDVFFAVWREIFVTAVKASFIITVKL